MANTPTVSVKVRADHFEFWNVSFTTYTDAQDEVWWDAIEVCDALDIARARDACERLDEDEKRYISVPYAVTNGVGVAKLVVNEPGIYHLVDTSRKPEAKAFKRWIRHEVIPAIRKKGEYRLTKRAEDAEKQLDTTTQQLHAVRLQLGEVTKRNDELQAESTTQYVQIMEQEHEISLQEGKREEQARELTEKDDEITAQARELRVEALVRVSRDDWFAQVKAERDELAKALQEARTNPPAPRKMSAFERACEDRRKNYEEWEKIILRRRAFLTNQKHLDDFDRGAVKERDVFFKGMCIQCFWKGSKSDITNGLCGYCAAGVLRPGVHTHVNGHRS
jgi:prophage antirepressor-like protein